MALIASVRIFVDESGSSQGWLVGEVGFRDESMLGRDLHMIDLAGLLTHS